MVVGKCLGVPAAALQEVGVIPREQLGGDWDLKQGLEGSLGLGIAAAAFQQPGVLVQQYQGGRIAGRQRHRPQGGVPVVRRGGDRRPQEARRHCKRLVKVARVKDRQCGLGIAALQGIDRPGESPRASERRFISEGGRNPDDGVEITGHQASAEGVEPYPRLFRDQALTLRQQVRALGVVAAEAGE